jgi:hypothetical protein
LAGLLGLLITDAASGADERDKRASAAAAYDEGVKHFQAARYPEATRSFLRADEFVPSRDALLNAIAAARRANDHMLIVEAAQRATVREPEDAELAAKARQALSEASLHLGRLDISCAPTPCSLKLDEAGIGPGVHYVFPGLHTIGATAPKGGEAMERVQVQAGAKYVLALDVTGRVSEHKASNQVGAEQTTSTSSVVQADSGRAPEGVKPLPTAAVYVGAAISVALVGLTTWSGVDTLAARERFLDSRSSKDREAVLERVTRTNWLLAGSVVAAGDTGYVALFLTNWGGRTEIALGLQDGLAPSAMLSGRF